MKDNDLIPLESRPERGMTAAEEFFWLGFIFLIIVPTAVGLYWQWRAS